MTAIPHDAVAARAEEVFQFGPFSLQPAQRLLVAGDNPVRHSSIPLSMS
jgi:hypothetical protein